MGHGLEPPSLYAEKPAGREPEPAVPRYEGGYAEPSTRGYDPRFEEQWAYLDDRQSRLPRPPFEAPHPRDLDSRPHPGEPSEHPYFPHFEEPAPLPYDGRARFEQLPRTSTLRPEEVPSRFRPEAQTYAAVGPKAPELKPPLEQLPRGYEQAPAQAPAVKAAHYEPVHGTGLPVTPPRPDGPLASSKPLPPLPASAATPEEDEDPAMKPQSVLTRVRMFEKKRSVSLESRKDENHLAGVKVRPAA